MIMPKVLSIGVLFSSMTKGMMLAIINRPGSIRIVFDRMIIGGIMDEKKLLYL